MQHLCTGADDEQVPAAISVDAASRWGVRLLVLPSLGHAAGVQQCLRIALANLTANALLDDEGGDSGGGSLSGGGNASVGGQGAASGRGGPKLVYLGAGLMSWRRVDVGVCAALGTLALWLCSIGVRRVLAARARQCACQ